ncbi:MAG: light-harvesting protein [Betaproteobacteria bacterium]|nr:light-harvesting protein [Betaproteobacteria bacterium]
MNQGKIWLVVKPTVGLPLFLGGVAVIALSVHAAILTHTDWYPGYMNGNQKAKAAAMVAPAAMAPAAAPAAAAPAAVDKKGK